MAFSYYIPIVLINITVFQRIFYGLTMTSTVYAQRVRIWMDPYTKGQDQLSVLKNDYDNVISGNFSVESGVLELVQKGGKELTKNDWNTVLNYPTYRLFINVSALTAMCLFVTSTSYVVIAFVCVLCLRKVLGKKFARFVALTYL